MNRGLTFQLLLVVMLYVGCTHSAKSSKPAAIPPNPAVSGNGADNGQGTGQPNSGQDAGNKSLGSSQSIPDHLPKAEPSDRRSGGVKPNQASGAVLATIPANYPCPAGGGPLIIPEPYQIPPQIHCGQQYSYKLQVICGKPPYKFTPIPAGTGGLPPGIKMTDGGYLTGVMPCSSQVAAK